MLRKQRFTWLFVLFLQRRSAGLDV